MDRIGSRSENRSTTRRLFVAPDAVAFPVSRGSSTLRRPSEQSIAAWVLEMARCHRRMQATGIRR